MRRRITIMKKQKQKHAQILHGIPNSPNKNRRRQRNAHGERNKSACGNLSTIMLHVTIATICNILRTAEAFRIVSVSTQWRPTQTNPTRIQNSSSSSSYDPSSSSLYVLSSPRRRTSSSNKGIDLPSPIELNPSLMVNLQEINGNDSFFKILESTSTSTSMSTSRQGPLPTLSSTSTLQAPAPTEEMVEIEEASPQDAAFGAASKSSLFRRQHSSAMEQDENYHHNHHNHHSPTFKVSTAASAILSNPKNAAISRTRGRKRQRQRTPSHTPTITEVTTVDELDDYWPRCLEHDEEIGRPIPQRDTSDPIDYNQLLRGISVKGDTQIIGAKDRPEFVHPVVQLMHQRKKEQEQRQRQPEGSSGEAPASNSKPKQDKIALVVEGGGMRGCVSAGMVCAIHALGLSDTIDVVYGSSAGAVIAAYFVSQQLPYFGTEVYYDSLTTMEDPTRTTSAPEPNHSKQPQQQHKPHANHILDRYSNDYFIDVKRMTRSMGLGLCDPRLLKDVWTRRIHGKPMMNLHYMFEKIMLKKKAIDYDTFIQRQTVQPLKVVATGLSSEKPVVLSHEGGHFDTIEDLCHSLHASCLLPGIAGPVMNVLKRIRRKSNPAATKQQKPNFVLRNVFREKRYNDEDYEPLGDAMLSAPIPYDIAHEEGATHVLVIRSSPDGTNLLEVPAVMAWIGSKIFKRYFLKKNHLPGMYKRAQTEQRHQRLYAKIILELNQRANSPPPIDSNQDQTMTIALEPGSEEVNHLETTREGIFQGVRQGFARAYDALVEDPALRGKGQEMALKYFPDEILEYDPNDSRLSSSSSQTDEFRSAFEEYLASTGVVPKTWREDDTIRKHAMP